MHKAKTSAEEVKGRIVALVALSKRFSGFKMPEGIKEELSLVAQKLKCGKEGEAVLLGNLVETGLTNLLMAFFRNSPAYFDRQIKELNTNDFDRDVWEKLVSDYGFYLQQARSQRALTIEQCADDYCSMLDSLARVKEEQERRVKNRQAKLAQRQAQAQAEQQAARLAAEERHKEEQRQREQKRRDQIADELLAMIA